MTEAEEVTITNVDKDQEKVHVFFGDTGQVAISPIKNKPTVQAKIYIDDLDPEDRIRIVDPKQKWDLREIDDYFHERRDVSVQSLSAADEQLAREIGRWFVSYTEPE